MLTRFSLLPISAYLKSAIHEFGIIKLTPVQQECFGPIMAGHSITAIAKTGTGKTLAYLIPVVARMENERFGPFSCLIVVPSRELCQQIGSVLVRLKPALHVCLAYGKPTPEFDTLIKEGPHVIVGTAARVNSLVKRGDIDLGKLKILVIDELDSMLQEEYRKSLSPFLNTGAVKNSKGDRTSHSTYAYQRIGIGATLSLELRNILKKYWPLDILIDPKDKTLVKHELMKVPKSLSLRIDVMVSLLSTRKPRKCIVFVKNSDEANQASRHLNLNNKVIVLHSELSPTLRDKVLNEFRSGDCTVLVCTDIAARGIDVPEVDLVFSLTPPSDSIAYTHRAGRTGRAGTKGTSILFYSEPAEYGLFDSVAFDKIPAPSKYMQKDAAMAALIAQCETEVVGDKLTQFCDNLRKNSPNKAAALTVKCIETLLGFAQISPTRSMLSNEVGFQPILFPIESDFTSVRTILDNINIKYGTVLLSESGYIADIPTGDVTRLCDSCESVKLVDHLPKLVAEREGSKRRVLPWRRETKIRN